MITKLFTSIAAIALCCAAIDAKAQEIDASVPQAQAQEQQIAKKTVRIDSIVLEKQHSIRVGYGITGPLYNFRLQDPAIYMMQHYYRGSEKLSGVVFAEYSYRPLRWLEAGVIVSHTNLSRQFYNRITDQNIGAHTLNTLAFAAHVRFMYLTKPIVRLYSGLSFGVAIAFEQIKIDQNIVNHNFAHLNGGVTLFGVSVGRRLYGFAELSVGTLGFLNFGIGYRFKSK